MNARRPEPRTPILWTAVLILTSIPGVAADHLPELDQRAHADFAVTDIAASRLVLDVLNEIKVSYRNNGPEAGAGLLVLSWNPGAATTADATRIIGAAPIQADAGQGGTETFEWDARDLTLNAQTGTVTLVAAITGPVDEQESNNVMRRTLFVARYALGASFPTPSNQETYPSQRAVHVLRVENLGNVDDRVTLSVQDASPQWTYSFAQNELLLAAAGHPGAVMETRLFVTPPQGASAGAASAPSVVATSGGNSDVAVTIDAPSTLVRQVYGLLIDRTVPQAVRPQQQASFELRITNTGNGDDSIQLSRLSVPPSWDVSFQGVDPAGRIEVPAGATRSVTADIRVPAGEPVGERQVTIGAVSEDQTTRDQALLRVQIQQMAGVRVTLLNPSLDAEPGSATDFLFEVKNTGNGNDVFRPSASTMPPGWGVTFDRSDFLLGANRSLTLRASVTPRPGERSGHFSVGFQAKSVSDPTAADSEEADVFVQPAYGVGLAAATYTRGVKEGEATEFAAQVLNAGNRRDTLRLTIGYGADSSPSPDKWNVTLSSVAFELGGGEARSVTLRVIAPKSPPLGVSDRLRVFLRVASDNESGREKQVTFTVTPKLPDLRVENVGVQPSPAYQGQNLTLTATVRNVGEKDVAGAFELVPKMQRLTDDGSLAESFQPISPRLVPALRAGDVRQVTFSIPTGTLEGTYRVSAVVDAPNAVVESDDVENNANATDVVIRKLQLKALAAPPAEAGTGEVLRLEDAGGFRVRNEGAYEENLLVEATTAAGWDVSVDSSFLSLAPGQESHVPLSVYVPTTVMGVPTTTLRLQVQVVNHPGLTRSAVTRIDVEDVLPPLIVDFGIEGAPLVGARFRAVANVTDNVAVQQASVLVTGQSGYRAVVPMVRSEGHQFAAELLLPTPGLHRMVFRANDASANRANDSKPLDVDVAPWGNAAVLPIGWKDGVKVRAGGRLQLDLNASGGVRDAHYSLDGQRQEFIDAGPYTVDTIGLSQGVHALRVSVSSLSGIQRHADYSLNVDNTAPTLTESRITPNRLKPGDQAHIVVRSDSADVAKAAVVLQLITGATDRQEMERTSEGNFFAIVAIGSGLRSLRVELVDDVGNTALIVPQEFVGALSAGSAGTSPGAPLGSIVAALAACLWVRRRGEGDA